MIVFRRLVVIGLVVSLGSLGLGCGTSYPKYGTAHEHECDLPDAPSDKLYIRGVQTETSGIGNAYKEFTLTDPMGAAEWTRYEIGDNSPLEACSQYWLDKRASTQSTPTTKARIATTTTKASTVDVDRCRSAMKELKRVLYTSDNEVFDNAFRVTLRVCGNRRTWQSVAREVGGSIDGMLTAACMLNGNTAVCKN